MFIPVIGAGSIGRRHFQNLHTLGVKTALLPWREFNASVFRRLGATGVVIATETQVRLELVSLCAELGIPFYCEKPLAYDPATVDEILNVAGPLAKRSMAGFMMRYHPAVKTLAETDLSTVYDASFGIGHDVRLWRKDWSFAGSYSARAEGGGVLLDLCHELDLAHLLFPGLAEVVVLSLGHDSFPGVDFATRVALAGQDVTATVAMDYLSPVSFRRITLRGTRLVVEFDLIAERYQIDEGQGPGLIDMAFDRNEMFLAAMRDFLHLVAGESLSDARLAPRLDRVADTCRAVAKAWQMRRFVGKVEGDYP
ncbi:MAG: hypothetical protein DI533_18955 [Cereibacter sphaeroides]|uniref:Gfo/Idh/MocA family oxidoreductase n=1 Tax=Cereibacter sphaeroides TaxID=1063 RepID=A0A2W5S3Y0_CERSP|nr:MAG: hypothetical protein DI533_18955 [Cereibacter sphaeroides]